MNNAVRIQTGCKINLGLNITERRPDGYHNLQTIFYPVPLFDELTIREGEGEDVLTLGDHVKVKCLGKDRMGRMSFSIKDAK